MKTPIRDIPLRWNKSHSIYTDNVENEIWLIFENLSGIQYLETIIKRRINDDHVKNLTNIVIQKIKNKDVKRADSIQFLTDEDVPNVTQEARNIILQAKDIYFAARPLPLLSKPILLFYCFEKLAELLYSLTYRKIISSHGLKYDRKKHIVTICRNGLYANFHDSFSDDPFYLNDVCIRFEDIIECGPINRIELENLSQREFTHLVTSVDDKQISLTEVDREFIFLYGLSILARYDVRGWSKVLSGEQNPISDNIKVINHMRSYTNAIETLFPKLILDEIYLMGIWIYSPARLMATEWEHYDDKALP